MSPLRAFSRAVYLTMLYPGYGLGLALMREFGGPVGHTVEKGQRVAGTATGIMLLTRGRSTPKRALFLAGGKVAVEDAVFNTIFKRLGGTP